MVFRDVAGGGASIDVRLRAANDRQWLAGSAPARPATGARTTAKTAKTAGQLAKALIRTSEDAELVAQGKGLEQEVSTRRPSRADPSTRPDDGSHHVVECRPAPPTSMGFWPDAILATHRLWTSVTAALLGLWLISSPLTFGYARPALLWNDVASGVLLALFSMLACWPQWDFVGRWTVAFVGLWLQVAPLVFWAPDGAAYLNDTLVGALAIALSILVPMMPGMAHHMEMMKPGPEIAPGWSYNPSTWHQRAPMIVLGFLGWLISRYLAAFQLGYIQSV